MTRPRAPSPSTLLGCFALAGVYVATGLLFRLPALRPISDGLTWPPVGLALAGLLLFGLRLWPGVVAGAFLEHWMAGVPLANSLGSTLGITIETVGAAWLLGRTDFRPSLERVRLLNPGPASAADYRQFRKERLEKLGADLDRLRAVATTDGYKAGDPDAVAAYYRIHFKAALRRPEDYERLMARMRPSFTTSEDILKARHVEDRLMADTWSLDGYDLLPKLRNLTIPTLVIYGDHDFIPSFAAEHIAEALPTARFVTMKECGHFAYLECPGPVRKEIDGFFRNPAARARPK